MSYIDRFSSINGYKIYQVLGVLQSLDQDDKSVEIYYHKLKNFLDEYVVLEPIMNCTYGAHKVQEERDQRKKLIKFLMGLQDSYSTARGQILIMDPLSSVNHAYPRPSVNHAYSLIK